MVNRTVARSAQVYRQETGAVKRAQENKLQVVEIRMLRRKCRVTNLDSVKNERIRGTTNVFRNIDERPGKKVEVVRACDAKRVPLRSWFALALAFDCSVMDAFALAFVFDSSAFLSHVSHQMHLNKMQVHMLHLHFIQMHLMRNMRIKCHCII